MAMVDSFSFFVILLFPFAVLSLQRPLVFNGFNDTDNIKLGQGAFIEPSGLLRLTDNSQSVIGHAFYRNAVQMFDNSSGSLSSPNISSFSATFVFAIVPSNSGPSGYGLAFVLAPSTELPGAQSEHYLGLVNASNDGNATNHIFAVEFDTVRGHNEKGNSKGNHVGINKNGVRSNTSEPPEYLVNGTEQKIQMFLDSGDPIQVWIEYDGIDKRVNVTIAPEQVEKPTEPLLSHRAELSTILKEQMFVGFSASTGKLETSFHYILGWSFAINGTAPELNLTQLPRPPKVESPLPPPTTLSPQVIALVVSLSAVTLLGILFLAIIFKRRLNGESLEEWERDCPRRFSYTDLHKATKGFKHTELVGSGGFGSVYKGVILSTRCEIAVKKVTRNSSQGMREFAAEIESLGRLRYKNLVNLQGWCKKKNDLLIVYDFIPNGSLYSLLYHPKDNFVLNWKQRFNILKGIAAGLLYLHEEWERVVIHRDVKPSNVLIDADMNARLSDFGLARLYDHDQISHTTSVVGTIGYISPELARTGKASKTTDVFAYGVLLLEVACGRRPLGSNEFILVDWVMESHGRGRILDAADPKLNEVYEVNEMEMEMVLQLGLLCSHHKPEARPTMRQVMRYLHGEDQFHPIDPSTYSQIISKFEPGSGFTEFIPTTLCSSSSTGLISSTSLDTGR